MCYDALGPADPGGWFGLRIWQQARTKDTRELHVMALQNARGFAHGTMFTDENFVRAEGKQAASYGFVAYETWRDAFESEQVPLGQAIIMLRCCWIGAQRQLPICVNSSRSFPRRHRRWRRIGMQWPRSRWCSRSWVGETRHQQQVNICECHTGYVRLIRHPSAFVLRRLGENLHQATGPDEQGQVMLSGCG